MPSPNLNCYKEILKKYDEMKEDFTEKEWSEAMEDIFQTLYSISDFYDSYNTLEVKLESVLNAQTLVKEKEKYEKMLLEICYMNSRAKEIYRDRKTLMLNGGGFSSAEERRIATFKIDYIMNE